jgi:acetylglutamate/LysW-gamma-L-alpha-aminoadipate kinase
MIVVKLGGAEGNDIEGLIADLPSISPCVVVHGGSKAITDLQVALGREPRMATSPSGFVSRVTDTADVEAVTMALAGKVNPSIVARMVASGISAVGLCGVDGGLLKAKLKPALRYVEGGKVRVLHGDLSGTIEGVNPKPIHALLAAGLVPVISPPAVTADGVVVNVDADRAAAALAVALAAEALVLLSNVPGLLRDPCAADSLIQRIDRGEVAEASRLAYGRMKHKLLAAQEALRGGVPRVVIGDSRVPSPLRAALEGRGTVIA